MLLATVGGFEMSFSMNLYYTGSNGSARAFADEMTESGLVRRIREFPGCRRYEYFISISDPETILLIDSWESQEALDEYHASQLMADISHLREKYNLHMKAERFIPADMPSSDSAYIRK